MSHPYAPCPICGAAGPFAVDQFCGRGGWTVGLKAAGFHVLGFDIEEQPDYPGDHFIRADVRDVGGERFRGAAVVVASPPCQGFSQARHLNPRLRDRRPFPSDFRNLLEAMRIIEEAEPEFWAIENVQGAVMWFDPILGPPSLRSKPYYLWGRFPGFILAKDGPLKKKSGPLGVARNGRPRIGRIHKTAAERSMIPPELSMPFAAACAEALP